MKTVEDAYQYIARVLLEAMVEDVWVSLTLDAPVLGENLGGTTTIQRLVDGTEIDIPVGRRIFELQEAVLFLRQDLLKTTGARIWGLTFTLYPDGKFHVDYDYNKPEGYEDADEALDLNEAIENLKRSGVQVEVNDSKKSQ